MQANAAVDRELRAEALEDLCARVDDWKNHRVDHFGELLQHGHFPVITGKSDVQKEVRPLFRFQKVSSIRDLTKRKATSSLRKRSRPRRGKDKEEKPLRKFSSIRDLTKRKATSSSRQRSLPRRGEDEEEKPLPWAALSSIESPTNSMDSISPPHEKVSTSDSQHLHADEDMDTCMNDMVFYEFTGPHQVPGHLSFVEQHANESGIICPSFEQYTIYLFERILLCCKELNTNKSKDKLMGAQKDKKDRKDKKNREPNKNVPLQLKGRIFMTNVTEVMSLARQGRTHC